MTGKPPNSVDGLPESLTERELEVLVCMADGLSNHEVASKLFLAEQTVRWYNSQIYSKLGVSSRHAAVERAQVLGLLEKSAPAPVVTGKHNLPTQATPFVGRQHELNELTTLLKDENTRLITILAPGGMGKTRLVLEVARLQIGRYTDGVIFVPLAPLSSPSDIVTTIAENIGFVFHGENPPTQQLTDFLRERTMLLVLDNFEHLLDGVQLVADIIQAAPHVRVLTTSRERLNLHGETVYILRGLEFPIWETPDDALQYDAVKLFMQSAHRIRADFTLHTHDLDYLARICRLTAGMPLGIELAAGWVDVLSLEQIAAEIQKGIDILETEMRDVPERQRSVRATFDRTWERLTSDEQTVFMHLSVFRGGFTVTAAQAVAGASVRSLRQLANKALVQVSPNGRYDIHELLRQFGAEKLIASEEEAIIQAKHAAYFGDFMAERKQDIHGSRQIEALDLIDSDFENIRSAWLHVVNLQQWDRLPMFLHSLWFYLDIRTRGQEAVELFEHAVSILQSAPSSHSSHLALGRVLARMGSFYTHIGDSEKAATLANEAIRILRQYDSSDDLLMALFDRGVICMFLIEHEIMLEVAQEGLNIAKSVASKHWEGLLLLCLAMSHIDDDPELGLHLAEKALEIHKRLDDLYGVMFAYSVLCVLTEDQKDFERTARFAEARLVVAEALNQFYAIAQCHTALGNIYLFKKDYVSAGLSLRKGLQVYWNGGYKWAIPEPLIYIAQIFARRSEFDKALELYAAVHKHLPLYMQINANVQALDDQLKTQLEPEHFAAAWARGEKRELSAVVVELLAELEG